MLSDQSMHSERKLKVRPQAGRTCEQSMIPSYPASIVCLRAKHAFRPKYAFGEKIHAGRTCLHSCARRAGVGWGWEGAKKKTGITTKVPCTHLWRHSELPRDTDRPKSANHLAPPRVRVRDSWRECSGALLRCVNYFSVDLSEN